jgi:hypothetical protein
VSQAIRELVTENDSKDYLEMIDQRNKEAYCGNPEDSNTECEYWQTNEAVAVLRPLPISPFACTVIYPFLSLLSSPAIAPLHIS